MSTFSEDFVPITPVNCFQIQGTCHRIDRSKGEKVQAKKFLLPDTSSLCAEESFADVSMGWHEEGLEFHVAVNVPFRGVSYPSVDLGDSVELFIDTRDVKTSGFNTRFCHHFFFLPEGVDGHFAGEITHFRTEDIHPLCEPNELKVKSTIKKNGYTLDIFIPAHCLHGYDPVQFNRLGFSYRINRSGGFPQHFSVITDDFAVEQQPSLLASFNLL
ncbi:MAG: hypothetical protein WCG42_04045 [Parachlamydiaceae bacterium]